MKYMDLYNMAKGANLTTKEGMHEVMDVLGCMYGENGLYGYLVYDDKNELFNKEDRDKFFVKLFNHFKSRIFRSDAANRIKQEAKPLVEYLKELGEVTNMKQVQETIQNEYVHKYFWHDMLQGHIHCFSEIIEGGKGISDDIKHRLYLNLNNGDTYNLLNEFVDKCCERKIPYYFKITDGGLEIDRKESVVIYSDNNNILNYVEILREIAKEKPHIVENSYGVIPLTANIDNWIYYGSEPLYGEYTSHNILTEKIVVEAGKKAITNVLSNMSNYGIYNEEERKSLITDIIRANMMMDYEMDFENDEMQKQLRYMNSEECEKYLQEALNGQDDARFGDFFWASAARTLKEKSIDNEKILDTFRENFIETCKKYNKDYENFAFDLTVKNELEQLDKEQEANNDTNYIIKVEEANIDIKQDENGDIKARKINEKKGVHKEKIDTPTGIKTIQKDYEPIVSNRNFIYSNLGIIDTYLENVDYDGDNDKDFNMKMLNELKDKKQRLTKQQEEILENLGELKKEQDIKER